MSLADELKLLKEYVKTLEGQNQSKNRQRATLEMQLRDLAQENQRLRAAANPDLQNYMMKQFEELRFSYNRMEIELTNKINQLEASNRILEAEKIRIENESATWKSKVQSGKSSTIITVDQHSDYNKRIAQLNRIIVDLNQEINAIKRQPNTSNVSSEAISQMRAVIEDLHAQNKKLQHERDVLTNKTTAIERQVVQLRTQLSRRGSQKGRQDSLQKQRIVMMNEISSLKSNNVLLTRTVEANNKRAQEKEMQNNNLRTHIRGLDASINEYRMKEQQHKTQLTRLKNQLQVLKVKLNSKGGQQNQLLSIANTNNQLKSEILLMNQQKQHLEMEIQRNLQAIQEAQQKIYILETANYNLSEQLRLSINQRKVSVGSESVIQALKQQIMNLKNDNHKFSDINREILEQYRQLQQRYQSLQMRYKQDVVNKDPTRVFVQKWNETDYNRPSPTRNKIYRANPVDGQQTKWSHLQKKILNLKAENEELKRSLNFAQI